MSPWKAAMIKQSVFSELNYDIVNIILLHLTEHPPASHVYKCPGVSLCCNLQFYLLPHINLTTPSWAQFISYTLLCFTEHPETQSLQLSSLLLKQNCEKEKKKTLLNWWGKQQSHNWDSAVSCVFMKWKTSFTLEMFGCLSNMSPAPLSPSLKAPPAFK